MQSSFLFCVFEFLIHNLLFLSVKNTKFQNYDLVAYSDKYVV